MSAAMSGANTGAPAVVVQVQVPVGPTPTSVTCPSCHSAVTTKVRHVATAKTYIIAVLCCLIGCCPLAILPFCMDSCRNAEHNCANCNAYIGTYKN